MIKSIIRFVLPILTGALVIGTAGVLVHLYRATWTSGSVISPVLPRAQFSFSVRLPKNQSPHALPLLLRVVKDKNALFSVNYWQQGRTVFQMPILDPASEGNAAPVSIRLALWDPGRYTVIFADPKTGSPIQNLSLSVAPPLGLYRNDLILLILLAGAGFLSGRIAWDTLPFFSNTSRFALIRKLLIPALSAAGILLILSSGHLFPGAGLLAPDQKNTGFLESEGRPDAPRMILPLSQGPGQSQAGYLVLRHRLDSWLRFGQDLTLFEGLVERGSMHHAFILPPDDGKYRLSLWSGHAGSLTEDRSDVNAIPLSPDFPFGVFLGLTLFASAFFLLGLTGSCRSISGAMRERLH